MTTDEKFRECFNAPPEWVDGGFVGYPCGVLTCPHNFNGQGTCDDYQEDHCFAKLYHQLTNAKAKYLKEDENGNEVLCDNECAYGGELNILEPWVREDDIPLWQRNQTSLTKVGFLKS